MRPQPLITMTDLEAGSRWYRTPLGRESADMRPRLGNPDGYAVVLVSPDRTAGGG